MDDQILQNPTIQERYIPHKAQREQNLQRQVCHYLRLQYPNVIFRSDFASGMHLTMNQAVIHKSLQSTRAWPDLFIYEPRTVAGKFYCGLAIELKKEGVNLIVSRGERKGHLTSDPHIQEQFIMLKELRRLGYYSNFAVGFENDDKNADFPGAKNLIDWYFDRGETNEAMF